MLRGKLLLMAGWTASREWQSSMHDKFPELEIVATEIRDKIPQEPSDDFYKDAVAALCDKVCFQWSAFRPGGAAQHLRYVQLISAGADSIQKLDLFRNGSVPFCAANGIHPPQIAEWVIVTYLAHLHRIPEYLEHQRKGIWKKCEDDEDGEDAMGLTCGVLGYGAIGRQVAVLANALGMSVYAHTLRPRETSESRKDDSYCPPGIGDPEGLIPQKWTSGADAEDINSFLQDLDLLVICMPLTGKTRRMIGSREFQTMSDKRTFVSNIGRGAIIDTEALCEALDKGLISGAALDVTDPEPLPPAHPLWNKPNCIITPHISGNSKAYNKRVLDIVKINLERLDRSQPLINQVDVERGY